jgi:nucleotide-binding universal stress UspA family protein
MKMLLAADGSEYTKRAARHVVEHLGWLARPAQIHVLHVRPPLPYPGAAAVVGKKAIEKYEREESEAALAVAEKVLGKAGVAYESAWRVGDVAAVIAGYAKANGIDLIVMGSHGHGALAGLALGSVTTKVLASSKTPVLIVR